MNTGKTLFAQLMEFLPWKTFSRIVARYGGDSRVRTLSCGEQYRAMAFAQLTYRESLPLLWQFFRFHRYRLRFAFPIRNSYPTDIPRKVPLNCQGSAIVPWIPFSKSAEAVWERESHSPFFLPCRARRASSAFTSGLTCAVTGTRAPDWEDELFPGSDRSSWAPRTGGAEACRSAAWPILSCPTAASPVPGKISFDVGLYAFLGIFLYFLSRIVRDRTLSYPAFVKD